MKLKDFRERYYDQSGKTSDIVRNLGFAGIAAVWLFKVEKDDVIIMNNDLILSGVLFILGLGFDLLHAISNSAKFGLFFYFKGKKAKDQEDVKWNSLLDYPGTFFFIAKIIVISIGYIFLLVYLINRLKI